MFAGGAGVEAFAGCVVGLESVEGPALPVWAVLEPEEDESVLAGGVASVVGVVAAPEEDGASFAGGVAAGD